MAIKLLLIEDVESLGRKGNIVSVKSGYARNFLLPHKFAMIADKNTLRMKERLEKEREEQAITDRKQSEELAQVLNDKTVTAFVKVDHDGHMYGSVSISDILELIAAHLNTHLEKRSIQLKHPLKTIGTHKVELKLKEGVTASIHVKILAEGTVEEEVVVADEKAATE